MSTFEFGDIDCLITSRPERFRFEREIRLFQFQTWTYFPDDYKIVDAAGRLAAAALLRAYERAHAKKPPGMSGYREINSKILIGFLKDRRYGALYDALFRQNGWTEFLDTPGAEEFNAAVLDQRRKAETVSQMIDFLFRAIDHGTMTKKQATISRAEFYRWYKHPNGELSWRTIRSRWSANRTSAPFLYASEILGFKFFPPNFDWRRPKASLAANAPNQKKIRDFVKTSLYVAEKINSDVLEEFLADQPVAGRLRPATDPLDEGILGKMRLYKDEVTGMRFA